MDLNTYEEALVRNADWFVARQGADGFIRIPADEYYGIPGDASLIGHSMSVRTYAWFLTKDSAYLESAKKSAAWLAERQDPSGGWHHDAGYSLDAAQCVMEGFATLERLTGERTYHETLTKAADRMLTGTVDEQGRQLIGNTTEIGEYAHHAFLAWRLTGLEKHRAGGHAIVKCITSQFDEAQGYWNTVGDIHVPHWMDAAKPALGPILRCSMSKLGLKGRTIAQISEKVVPLAIRGRGPQYCLGMMDAEALLDTMDGAFELPLLKAQTERAVAWVKQNCAGPVAGSFCESKRVPESQAVYPLPAINDADNASLWPTSAVLLAMVGLGNHGDDAQAVADWLVSMQDDDGSFWTHQDKNGKRFGEKYGNINFYGATALWYYNWAAIRKQVTPTLYPENKPDSQVARQPGG